MNKYDFGGWANLYEDFFLPKNFKDNMDWKTKVTNSSEIKIYLDQGRCHNSAIKHYHKIYNSNNGFTIGKIFSLVFETYKSSINDVYEGYECINDNLALTSFEFDANTNSVYPNCDS